LRDRLCQNPRKGEAESIAISGGLSTTHEEINLSLWIHRSPSPSRDLIEMAGDLWGNRESNHKDPHMGSNKLSVQVQPHLS